MLAATYLSIAFLPIRSPREVVALGYFFGTLYAHASLAAVWTALGPGALKFRLPVSIIWILVLPAPAVINVALFGRPPLEFVVALWICLIGQWLILLLFISGVVWRFGLQLGRMRNATETAESEPRSQFTIRDLMVLMTLSACIIGLGRVSLPLLTTSAADLSVFIFLSLAAIVLNLPLLLAALVERFAIISVLLSIVFLAVATYFELPIMTAVGGRGPKPSHFVAINVFSSALIIGVAIVVRLNGFRLFVKRKRTQQPVTM
jgi:hypothetical protein